MFETRSKNIKCLISIYLFSICLIVTTIIYCEQVPSHIDIRTDKIDDFWPPGELFNLHNFTYLLNGQKCPGNTLVALIVTSYAGDVETRSSFRQAYSQQLLSELGINRVFLLALIDQSKHNEVSQEAIVNEYERFGDIVQGNFIENYRNLTYKHVMGLKWAAFNCPQADFVIKMDHDIVVDLFSIVEMLKKLPERKEMLAGYVMSNMKPIREPANKWFVTNNEYDQEMYPDFLSGWLYLTNPYTAGLLCETARTVPYFWIDDTYVTGLVAQKLSIPLVTLNKFYTTHPEHLKCCIALKGVKCDFWIGPNGGDNRLVREFQRHAEYCHKFNCRNRLSSESVRETCPVIT